MSIVPKLVQSFSGTASSEAAIPNDLEACWLPFTANRQFKRAPRLLQAAEGMYYRTTDGQRVLDGSAGLWAVNAGHCRREIVEAVQRQVAELDYATAFQMSHPKTFLLASRLRELLPGDMDHVFFTNSGSEAVDTALKIALAYHQACGDTERTVLVGRHRGYHGVGFGGLSVGGIAANQRQFPNLLTAVDHLPDTHLPEQNAFSRGQPEHGAERADGLLEIIERHGADRIAAVIVEPVAGSTGVLVPPVGYLERLRAHCDDHGILLIFDEVICGFGRLGAAFAAERFGVQPDLMTMAKGLTNATVPMGAVGVRKSIHDALMAGPENMIELFHGYTYSGHPLACAAALATLDLYRDEQIFERAASSAPAFEEAAHTLDSLEHVVDVRNLGFMAGIELRPRDGDPGERGREVFLRCYEAGVLVRYTGDVIAVSPPLIISGSEIEHLFATLRSAVEATD
ncbi:MAG: aspartate aminotransferase family protein [Alphaproteobacteria bacterium]|nr:aspartate aminotransferase family protein [Alphaproteobacteria bacterium]